MTIISSNIISIIMALFLIIMIKRDIMLSKYDYKFFIFAAVANIIMLILEIADFYLESKYVTSTLLYRNIINGFGFALSPIVAYFLILFNINKKSKNIFYLSVPLYLNIILCLCSMKTGWVFSLNSPNDYMRGALFPIPFIISLFYMGLFIVIIVKNNRDYLKNEILFLVAILVITIMCFSLQVVVTGLYLIWSSVSVGLFLYYMFLREMRFGYDVMTDVKNRATFDKDINNLQKHSIVGLIIVDINDLKTINDNKGHIAGDKVIINSAKIIKESFINIGNCYRIGGDEFCVICINACEEKIKKSLYNLECLLVELNKKNSMKTIMAYGYTIFKKHSNESISKAFSIADDAMYKHKDELKRKAI